MMIWYLSATDLADSCRRQCNLLTCIITQNSNISGTVYYTYLYYMYTNLRGNIQILFFDFVQTKFTTNLRLSGLGLYFPLKKNYDRFQKVVPHNAGNNFSLLFLSVPTRNIFKSVRKFFMQMAE